MYEWEVIRNRRQSLPCCSSNPPFSSRKVVPLLLPTSHSLPIFVFRLCPEIFSYKREGLGGLGLLCLGRTGNPKSLVNIAHGNANCSNVLQSNLESSTTFNNTYHFGSNRPAFGFWLLEIEVWIVPMHEGVQCSIVSSGQCLEIQLMSIGIEILQ